MFHFTTCPTCQNKFKIPEGNMQKRHVCPNCHSPFLAGGSVSEGPAPQRPATEAPAPMLHPAGGDGYNKTMLGETGPPITFNCPRCKRPQEAEAIEAGTKKACASCGQRLQVPAAAPAAAPPAAKQPNLNKTMLTDEESPAAPLPPIRYPCPNCKKPLESPAAEAGTKKNCPSCGQRHQIPAASKQPNLNKTMLTDEDSPRTAPSSVAAGRAPGAGQVGQAAAQTQTAGAAAAPAWPMNLSRQTYTIAGIVGGLLFLLLLLLLFVPSHDRQAFAAAQKQVDDLKREMEKIQQEQVRLKDEERRNEERKREIEDKRRESDEGKKAFMLLFNRVADLDSALGKQKISLGQQYDQLADIQDEDLRRQQKVKLDQQKAKLREEEEKKNALLGQIEEAKRKAKDDERRARDDERKWEAEQKAQADHKRMLELQMQQQNAAMNAAMINASRPPYHPWHPRGLWPW